MAERRSQQTLTPWTEGDLRALAAVRIGWAGAWLLFLDGFAGQLWQPGRMDALWDPQSLARLTSGPVSAGALQILWFACVVGTLGLGLGWRTRVVGPVLFGLSAMLGALCYSYGKIDPTSNILLLLLLAFAFSPWGHRFSLDARRRGQAGISSDPAPTRYRHWPLHLATAALVLPYASAGLLKLVHWGDPGMAMSRSLQWWTLLEERGAFSRPAWASLLADRTASSRSASLVLGLLAPLTEIGVAGALLSDRLRIAFLGLLCSFQGVLTIMSGINLQATWAGAVLVAGATYATLPGGARRSRWFPATPVNPGAADSWPWTEWVALGGGLVAAVLLANLRLAGWPAAIDPLPGFAAGDAQFATPTLAVFMMFAGALVFAGNALVACRGALRRLLRPDPRPGGVLLYDQDCGFCQRWVRWATARGAAPATRFAPCQASADVRRQVALPYSSCMEEAYLVIGPHAYGGAAAINGVLARLPGGSNAGWRGVALLYGLNGIRHVQDVGYALVARNRHRLAPGECEIPAGET